MKRKVTYLRVGPFPAQLLDMEKQRWGKLIGILCKSLARGCERGNTHLQPRPAHITLTVRAGTGNSCVRPSLGRDTWGGTQEPSWYMGSSQMLGEKWRIYYTEHKHSSRRGRAARAFPQRGNTAFNILTQVWLKYSGPSACKQLRKTSGSHPGTHRKRRERCWEERAQQEWGKNKRILEEEGRTAVHQKLWHCQAVKINTENKHPAISVSAP